MEASFVEEVAASLVREFLSKKGLKKTSAMMDEEFPRTALSINNRNELRNVLHLQSLYKQNKAKENPLKTILEIVTNFFLEHHSNSKRIKSPQVPPNLVSQPRCTENSVINHLSDEDTCGQIVPEMSKTEIYSSEINEEISQPATFSRRHPCKKIETSKSEAALDSSLATEREKQLASHWEDLKIPELSLETRPAMREKLRARPGLIARGMMAGPTASFQEDSLKRRHLKRPSGIGSTVQLREEDGSRSSFTVSTDDFQESHGAFRQSPSLFSSHSGGSLDTSKDRSPKGLCSPYTNARDETTNHSAKGGNGPFAKPASESLQGDGRKLVSGYDMQRNERGQNLNVVHRQARAGREKRETSPKKSEIQFLDCRKPPASIPGRDRLSQGALEIVDVEEEADAEEAFRIPGPPTLYALQVTSKPIDFLLARDLKTLLFGSSLGCFSEEWKIQSFSFSDLPQLKYGIVQKKGGPCGVLAAVQASVLRHLIFGDRNRNGDAGCLQTSDAHRTKCLMLALTDILWRAGSNERATVALCAGTQQFTPAGKYKADGILEMLTLHVVTKYEDLLKFLQQNIYQFEAGPFGCILLTLSVILSRSLDQVRGDFDVITNRLIGAHGYCTQELVNLLLTGKAVSNVFNDMVELDSGNGNITVLKGVSGRSEVGLLSLFEHYNVCQDYYGVFTLHIPFLNFTVSQPFPSHMGKRGYLVPLEICPLLFRTLPMHVWVGCNLKTPKFPIWLVCSESHFSVLFCLRKDLLGDWKMERRFDLYYYDGLANQQEEICLTVDTSQPYIEDKDDDLVPPLEHCIRTKCLWEALLDAGYDCRERHFPSRLLVFDNAS